MLKTSINKKSLHSIAYILLSVITKVNKLLQVCLNHKIIQQVFIVLQALGSSTSYDGSNGPPLSRHQLGQMKKLLLFFS